MKKYVEYDDDDDNEEYDGNGHIQKYAKLPDGAKASPPTQKSDNELKWWNKKQGSNQAS